MQAIKDSYVGLLLLGKYHLYKLSESRSRQLSIFHRCVRINQFIDQSQSFFSCHASPPSPLACQLNFQL